MYHENIKIYYHQFTRGGDHVNEIQLVQVLIWEMMTNSIEEDGDQSSLIYIVTSWGSRGVFHRKEEYGPCQQSI